VEKTTVKNKEVKIIKEARRGMNGHAIGNDARRARITGWQQQKAIITSRIEGGSESLRVFLFFAFESLFFNARDVIRILLRALAHISVFDVSFIRLKLITTKRYLKLGIYEREPLHAQVKI